VTQGFTGGGGSPPVGFPHRKGYSMQDTIYSQRLSDLFKEYVKSYKNYDVNEIFLTAGVLGMVGFNSYWDTDGIVKMGRKIEQSLQAQGKGYEVYNFGCDDDSWYLIAESEDDAELQLRSIIEAATNQ
jgi:hypothetical protein